MLKLYLNTSNSVFDVSSEEYKEDNVVVFNQFGLNKINYKNELNGSENALSNFARISKNSSKVLIAGAYSNNYGVKRKSCVIADKGKLLGIQDMCVSYDSNNFSVGGSHKIFQTSQGKVGIIVDEDIFSFESIKAMSICDVDVIIAIIFGEEKPQFNYLIRAYSYLFGIPIVVLSNSSILSSDINGELQGSQKVKDVHTVVYTKKSYRLITTKKRGN